MLKLENKTAIITGASQGLGLEIAKGFVSEGASVILCARNINKLLTVAGILNSTKPLPNQIIETAHIDISFKYQISTFYDKILRDFLKIDILVNNAGIIGPIGKIESNDWDGWLKVIETNLLGPVLMCRKILPHFKKNNYGKIVQLSGGGATKPFPNFSSYVASKSAVVHVMETLAEEVKQYHIDVNSVAPGALNTQILEKVLSSKPEDVGIDYYEKCKKQKTEGGADIKRSVDLITFLASSDSDGITGKLISAQWDPWEKFVDYKEQLKREIFCMRRQECPGFLTLY
jgi:NAD(P)-dependent dehydrogenase (short-subunit alcohol dehydrogenase family)